eukprot:3211604-Prymnesium_polylepis.1
MPSLLMPRASQTVEASVKVKRTRVAPWASSTRVYRCTSAGLDCGASLALGDGAGRGCGAAGGGNGGGSGGHCGGSGVEGGDGGCDGGSGAEAAAAA